MFGHVITVDRQTTLQLAEVAAAFMSFRPLVT
jgi:hypothetical protein